MPTSQYTTPWGTPAAYGIVGGKLNSDGSVSVWIANQGALYGQDVQGNNDPTQNNTSDRSQFGSIQIQGLQAVQEMQIPVGGTMGYDDSGQPWIMIPNGKTGAPTWGFDKYLVYWTDGIKPYTILGQLTTPVSLPPNGHTVSVSLPAFSPSSYYPQLPGKVGAPISISGGGYYPSGGYVGAGQSITIPGL